MISQKKKMRQKTSK